MYELLTTNIGNVVVITCGDNEYQGIIHTVKPEWVKLQNDLGEVLYVNLSRIDAVWFEDGK